MSFFLSPDLPPLRWLQVLGGVSVVRSRGARIKGAAVALHCHTSLKETQAVAKEIKDKGGQACVIQADLKDEASVRGICEQARSQLGAVGILVNNASVFEYDAVDSVTRESWDMHMEVNLRAPLY